MKVDVLLGLQWGDEGKGKVVDVLTPKYDVVTRFQGGPNAGHTLEFEGQKYVLRSIPSGIFQGGKKNIIGNGVVLDPVLFRQEAESLAASGHDLTKQLCISKKAHLILPTHRVLDAAYEAAKGDAKIGTTGKGIGPTYTDKVSRNGLRVGDVLYHFEDKYELLNWIYYTEGFARLVDGITLENWDSHIAVLFETMRADKKFYENTVRCTPDTFGNYLFKVVRALFLEAVEALDNGTVPDADKAFFADFYAYGSCGTVRAWVAAGMKSPPEELARSLKRLAQDSEKLAYRRYVEERGEKPAL